MILVTTLEKTFRNYDDNSLPKAFTSAKVLSKSQQINNKYTKEKLLSVNVKINYSNISNTSAQDTTNSVEFVSVFSQSSVQFPQSPRHNANKRLDSSPLIYV